MNSASIAMRCRCFGSFSNALRMAFEARQGSQLAACPLPIAIVDPANNLHQSEFNFVAAIATSPSPTATQTEDQP